MKLPRALYPLRLTLAALSLALTTLAFGFAGDALTFLVKAQFGPALMSVGAHLAVTGGLCVALWLLATLCFGRLFCSIGCPLGIAQDLLGTLFFWRKNRPQPRWVALRKGLGVAVWSAALVGGWTLGLRFLEPWTLFGAILSGAWLPAVLIAAAVYWRRRSFCNSLCPVGALLACGAAMAPAGLRFGKACIRCGKCVKACPTGCLDPQRGVVDNGRCVRCMACVQACPVGAIEFGRNPGFRMPERRRLVRAGLCLLGGGVVGLVARKTLPLYSAYGPRARVALEGIYPPGAGSRQRFLSKCTDCRLCIQHCVGQVIQPAGTFGAVHLTFNKGMCEFNCKRCSEVCPTGALVPMTLAQKQRTRLGLAEVNLSLCVAAKRGFECGACAEHCPTGALRMKEDARGVRIPVLDTRLCIGCGSCEHPCPVRPIKAVRVWPIEVQVQAADPAEVFRPEAEPETAAGDEWLI